MSKRKMPVRSILAGIASLALGAAATTATAAETTVRWGPIEIPAAGSDGQPGHVTAIAGLSGFAKSLIGLVQPTADYPVNKPCSDCYITGIKPNLVFEDGTTANMDNGVMLHHVVNLNFSRPDITCRPGFGGSVNLLGLVAGGNERFFAAGNERTWGPFPPGYGYRVNEGDDWGLLYHLMNMSDQPKTVYFEYTFTWVKSGITRTRPLWLDVDQCNDSEVSTPAGYSDTHWDWTSDRSGWVVSIGGHVHDYGISTAWYNMSRGQNVYTSIAGYAASLEDGSTNPWLPVGWGSGADCNPGADPSHPACYNTVNDDPLGLMSYMGHISDMTWRIARPTEDFAFRVRKGNLTRLHVQYSRPYPADDDMGIMLAYLKEDFCLGSFFCF